MHVVIKGAHSIELTYAWKGKRRASLANDPIGCSLGHSEQHSGWLYASAVPPSAPASGMLTEEDMDISENCVSGTQATF